SARVYLIFQSHLWVDEFWTLELAAGHRSPHVELPQDTIIASGPSLTSMDAAKPWWTIWTSLGTVTHPPLYFILLRLWQEAFGSGEVAVRMLPLCSSLLAIAAMYRVTSLLHGRTAALWACALMALAGPQIYYA